MESFNLNLPVSTSSLSFDYADRDLPEWGTPILSEEEILSPTTPVGPVGDAEFDPSSNVEDDVPLLEFLSRQENIEDNAIALLLENTCVTGSAEEMSMAQDRRVQTEEIDGGQFLSPWFVSRNGGLDDPLDLLDVLTAVASSSSSGRFP